MSDIIIRSSVSAVPPPALDISIRLATLADLPAIDALQKKYHKQLGFFPRAQMEGYLKNGWVLLAEENGKPQCPSANDQQMSNDQAPNSDSALCPHPSALGYCASRDRYLKRDELGVIYQLCVDPSVQRKFIGAALLRAVFERAPYGCKLYCCWCAQDIAANYFWESMGFVPLAFRAGGRSRGQRSEVRGQNGVRTAGARIHIFWQKRIVAGDATTQYWFPSQTGAGAMGEDRLVLPIPPGVRWSDEMPRILPGEENPKSETLNPRCFTGSAGQQIQSTKSKGPKPKPAGPAPRRVLGGWSFAPPAPAKPAAPVARVRKPRERMKNDPKLIAAARELRDRWMEQVSAGRYLPASAGKYELGRSLAGPVRAPVGLLEAA